MIVAVDPNYCVCHDVDGKKVREYIELMSAGIIFPPGKAISKKDKYIIVDGNHRTAACRHLGWKVYHDVEDWEDVPEYEIRQIGMRYNGLPSI